MSDFDSDGLSPSFGPVGCGVATFLFLLMVAAALGMLYLPWSLIFEQK